MQALQTPGREGRSSGQQHERALLARGVSLYARTCPLRSRTAPHRVPGSDRSLPPLQANVRAPGVEFLRLLLGKWLQNVHHGKPVNLFSSLHPSLLTPRASHPPRIGSPAARAASGKHPHLRENPGTHLSSPAEGMVDVRSGLVSPSGVIGGEKGRKKRRYINLLYSTIPLALP